MTTTVNDEMLEDFFAFLNEKYEDTATMGDDDAIDAFNPETQHARAYQEAMNTVIHIFDYIKHQCLRDELDFTAEDILQRYTNFLNREVFAIRMRTNDVPEDSIIHSLIAGEIAPYDMVLNELRFMGITPDAGTLH